MRLGFDGKWLWAAAFVGLSALDYCLTRLLIEQTEGLVYESNPLAAWMLEGYGWAGLAVYKMTCSAVVLMLAAIVSRFRPRAGRRLLAGSVAMLVLVTGYSLSLWAAPAWASDDLRSLYVLQAQTRALEKERREVRLYADMALGLSRELETGRMSLAEATARLERELTQLSEYDPLRYMRSRYQGLSDQACLSATLIRGVSASLHEDPAQCRPCLDRLQQEFEGRYGAPLPAFARFEDARETPRFCGFLSAGEE